MEFSFDPKLIKEAEKIGADNHDFILLSEEELEELLNEKEKRENEES